MRKNYKPKEFAELLNVSVLTLQRWDNAGKLKAFRTPTNRRYYTYDQYLEYKGVNNTNDHRKTIIYTRVSTNGQKDDLKKQISRLEKDNEQKQKYETEDAVIKAVCENVKVDIPSGMIETETEDMLRNIETKLSYQGLKLEQYLQMMGKTAEEVKKEYEPQAIEAIKSRLMLEAVIKAEKIEATEDEIVEKMKEMAKNYGKSDDKEFMENENVRKYIKSGLESEKALEFLVKNAKMKK